MIIIFELDLYSLWRLNNIYRIEAFRSIILLSSYFLLLDREFVCNFGQRDSPRVDEGVSSGKSRDVEFFEACVVEAIRFPIRLFDSRLKDGLFLQSLRFDQYRMLRRPMDEIVKFLLRRF